jgi:thiamine pyrophosphokinase
LTVDGGTNKWYNFIKQNAYDKLKFPDLITGDLDSADRSIIDEFVLLGSQIVYTPNQDETDFAKALREIQKYSTSNFSSL